jgi:alpha-L-rhamnosidase
MISLLRRLHPRGLSTAALLFSSIAVSASADLITTGLRCDWAVDPAGIDSAPPHLAWNLSSVDRGARQVAWQVQAASSREALLAGRADAWDSGRREGDAQLQIPYEGRPLQTGEQVFWRVRAWDAPGAAAAWSEPATWTMGVVKPEDWKARWITDPALQEKTRPWLGFSTPRVTDENTPQWIALDLGRVQIVDRIVLHAIVHSVSERLGFPRWFKVEVAASPDFHDATVAADHTADPVNPWFTRVEIAVPARGVRYVRLTAPRLRMLSEDGGDELFGRLALSQIEVCGAGRNLAVGAAVTASASLEENSWSARAVVDGLGLPGANPRAASTLRLRREFEVGPGLRRATLFVCGLGHYTLGVNGAPVGDEDLLKPGWTDYSRTCLYDTRDLTARLHPGANALGLTLASGMYNVPDIPGRYTKFTGAPRALKALVQLRLDYADGRVETVVSDPGWKVAPGPITFSHVYGGEDYDAGRDRAGWTLPGFDDAGWTAAIATTSPGGTLRGASESAPALSAHESLAPVSLRTLRPGVEVYDLGQNAALMPRLRVHGPAGAAIKITPSELLHPDGSLDTESTHHGSAESTWNYRLAGQVGGEAWMPSFFYHGARYLQVERTAPAGAALPVIDRLEGVVVHSASPAAGRFSCSNELFNRIHTLVRWAQRSNLVSVLTDCPHRERLGWLEQYHLNGPSLRAEFDLTRLYTKTFGDMADAQRPNGLVPSIAPEYVRFDGDFRDSPEWGSTLILAAWQQFVWTADDTPLHRHYPAMQRYFDYLTSRAKDRLLSYGLGDWCDVGPKRGGYGQLTPAPLVATSIYYEDARALERIAGHLGRTDDARRYAAAATEIAASFNRAFLDAKTGVYATGSQTSQAFPLVLGLAPPDRSAAVLARLVQAVRDAGNGTTAGEIGYPYLLRALTRGGRSDVIFDLVGQTTRPGYGYQLAHGATSLTETWNATPHASQNHFMLGQVIEWFHQGLAGLAPDATAPGFAHVIVRPQPVGDVTWAEANCDSVRGPIAARWERSGRHFRLIVTLPANVRASVQLPAAAGAVITESGLPLAGRTDVAAAGSVDGRPAFEIGAGRYVFDVH